MSGSKRTYRKLFLEFVNSCIKQKPVGRPRCNIFKVRNNKRMKTNKMWEYLESCRVNLMGKKFSILHKTGFKKPSYFH